MIEDTKLLVLQMNERVGRVFFGDQGVGSCVTLFLNKVTYIITCRHVAFDIDAQYIPLYHLRFIFNDRAYASTNFSYHGSSETLDVCFFILRESLAADKCFLISSEDFVYQGMAIVVAGFPLALDDVELGDVPKFMTGRVSAGGIANVAVSDIACTLPNTSGGAVFSTNGSGRYLLGIHLGSHYHEDESYKSFDSEISLRPLVEWIQDSIFDEAPPISPTLEMAVETTSPLENTRVRSKYCEVNMQHKGSMSYFSTTAPIVM